MSRRIQEAEGKVSLALPARDTDKDSRAGRSSGSNLVVFFFPCGLQVQTKGGVAGEGKAAA